MTQQNNDLFCTHQNAVIHTRFLVAATGLAGHPLYAKRICKRKGLRACFAGFVEVLCFSD
jgi:hypothetical protein